MMAERNCKKCFHYKACKEVASHSGYGDINYTEIQCKHFIPTADVVPKSEVDYWKQQTFNACMNNGYLDPKIITHLLENADGHDDPTGEQGTDGLETAISYAKSKLASEIFAEIEKLKGTKYDWTDCVEWEGIAELKKKYTEGEQ